MLFCRENTFIAIYALFSDNKCPFFIHSGGGVAQSGHCLLFCRFFARASLCTEWVRGNWHVRHSLLELNSSSLNCLWPSPPSVYFSPSSFLFPIGSLACSKGCSMGLVTGSTSSLCSMVGSSLLSWTWFTSSQSPSPPPSFCDSFPSPPSPP